jgi:hypothetical protein
LLWYDLLSKSVHKKSDISMSDFYYFK